MRLSNVSDLKLQQLADSLRQIASKLVDPAAIEELIDRRAAMSPMRAVEMTFAYELASSRIENECSDVGDDEDVGNSYFDLDTAVELDDEVAYLDSRRLLRRHPDHPNWVAICDEGEPLGEVA